MALVQLPAQADKPVLRVVAPEFWCPYTCTAGSKQEGFTVDITRAVLAQLGIALNYQNMPYDRALTEVRRGAILDAAVPVIPGEAPDFIFTTEPVSAHGYCFYTAADRQWNYESTASLKSIQLVATSGYYYGDVMDKYIRQHDGKSVTLLRGQNIPDRMIQMVQSRRYDALIDDSNMIKHVMSQKQHAGKLRVAGCLPEVHHAYLAFSPTRKDAHELARKFDQGVRALRASGELQKILKRYGVEDWK